MSGLGLTFLRRGGLTHPTAGSAYIRINDEEVFNVLMANGVSSDGVGISKDDAARLTSIGTWFKGNTAIVTFNELSQFPNVKELQASAFAGCTNLISADFKNIETLGDMALDGCTAFQDYIDLSSVTSFGSNALRGVKARKVDIRSLAALPYTTSSSSHYGDKAVLEELIVSPLLTTLPRHAFYGYTALKRMVYADNNSNINELNMPNLMSIDREAFTYNQYEYVNNLGSIPIVPASSSGNQTNGVFSYNDSLRMIRFPAVTQIGAGALSSCPNLTTIICEAATPPSFGNRMLTGTDNVTFIYVPDEAVDAYKAATGWKSHASKIYPLSVYNG